MQLCTGACFASAQAASASTTAASGYHLNALRRHDCGTSASDSSALAAEIDDSTFALRLVAARVEPAVRWISALTNSWRHSIVAGEHSPQSDAGGKLVEIVCLHNQKLYSARRKLLSNDAHFRSRDRDPIASDKS